MLPEGWIEATIGDTAQFVSRGRSPSYVKNSDFPVVNQRAVRWGGIDEQHLKFVDPATREQWSPDLFIQEGDILWNSTGTGTIGRAALFKRSPNFGRMVVDSHVTIVRANRSLDPRYLFALIKSPLVQNVISDMQSGSTNQVELNRSAVLSTEVPLPPLAEQRRIVAKLDALTARLARAQAELERVQQFLVMTRKRLFDDAFSGKLTADCPRLVADLPRVGSVRIDERSGELEQIPAEWAWAPVGSVAEVSGGLTKNSSRDAIPTKRKYLRVANVYADELRLENISEIGCTEGEFSKTQLIKGDLLIVEGNGSLDQVGRAAIWNAEIEACSHQNHLIRVRAKIGVLPKYALLYLLSPNGRRHLESLAASSSGLHTLSISKVAGIPIPIPDLLEQSTIVDRLETAFARADRLEAEVARARALLDRLEAAILAKAFRGELVPQDPTDEPASVLLDRIRAERAAAPKPKRGRRAQAPRVEP